MPVRDLVLDIMGERIIPCIDGALSVPSHPHEQIEWGPRRVGVNGGGELRVIVDQKVRLNPFHHHSTELAHE